MMPNKTFVPIQQRCFSFLLSLNLSRAQMADVFGVVTDGLTQPRVPFTNAWFVGTAGAPLIV
jgi:hypothetical protein